MNDSERSQLLAVAHVMSEIIYAGDIEVACHMDDHLDWLEAIREGYAVDEIASMAADGFGV